MDFTPLTPAQRRHFDEQGYLIVWRACGRPGRTPSAGTAAMQRGGPPPAECTFTGCGWGAKQPGL